MACFSRQNRANRALHLRNRWLQALRHWAVFALASLGVGTSGWAQPIACHVAYGGAERTFSVPSVTHSQDAHPLLEGASFVLKVVNKVAPFETPSVLISTFVVTEQQQHLVHQASYTPAATPSASPHGFTGLQTVQDPQRNLELRYWCGPSGQ